MKPKIEICCGSAQDCQAAQRGGADRIELNSALALGGLTPTLANLIEAKKTVTLPIITMVRSRGAGFCMTDAEFEILFPMRNCAEAWGRRAGIRCAQRRSYPQCRADPGHD